MTFEWLLRLQHVGVVADSVTCLMLPFDKGDVQTVLDSTPGTRCRRQSEQGGSQLDHRRDGTLPAPPLVFGAENSDKLLSLKVARRAMDR